MSAEFAFVCACCRWPDDEERRSRLAKAASAGVEWDRVEALAAAHRVEGLVANGVAALDAGPSQAVAARFERIGQRVKARALQDVAETLRVSGALVRESIRHCILKGAPLGVGAYGTPLLKQSWDIDVLVAAEDAVRAAAVIVELGYPPFRPARPFTRAEFRRWSAVSKEAEFHSADGAVELHWGLADHPMLLAGLGLDDATGQTALLGDRSVPTLGGGATLAYLAVHGASHGWSRLKWLADFAAFLEAHDSDSRERLVEEANRWAVGLAVEQALRLSSALFGSEVGSAAPSPQVERLVRFATAAIRRRGEVADFDSDPVAGRAIARNRRGVMPSLRYRLRYAWIAVRGSQDRLQFPLPHWLGWAYWLIRPFSTPARMIARRVRRTANKPNLDH